MPGETLPIITEDGTLMNSGAFDGLPCLEGARKIVAWLADRKLATPRVQYRLHDWCISRQRYWGPPIPIIYCEQCGVVPVPEKDLPVELPLIEDFRPDDTGVSPLARHEEWYFVPCPQCGQRARRETDVSDTFLDSAWYHLRYPSTEFTDRPFDPARSKRWLPVSSYIGGNEHAVLHLLYARFINLVLQDLKHVPFESPYPKFRAHGLIVKDGAKMSKSRGNVVVPDAYIQQWGADTFRMYLMFLGPFQEGGDFRDEGIVGIRRFLEKVWWVVQVGVAQQSEKSVPAAVEQKLHRTIRKVTADTEALHYNTAIATMMEYVNELKDAGNRQLLEPLVIMLAPYAPHIAEEMWEVLGHKESVFAARWPAYDEKLASAGDVEIAVQVNGKLRSRLTVARGMTQDEVMKIVLSDPAVQKFVDGQKVKKVIYVQDRLVNLVI
jgi:leucyl-tRNA synthetase